MIRKSAAKPFTGRHMASILIAFFGVVIAVNVTMAVFATRTFGGKVVENSYVASQRFNGWLEQAREQDKLRWKARLEADATRRLVLRIDTDDGPLAGAEVEAVARHPLGRADDIPLRLRASGAGRYASETALPPGRWQVHLIVRHRAGQARLIERVS